MDQTPLAAKPLDKKPKPKRRAESSFNAPPFYGVVLVVAVVIALAIGYGAYRDNSGTAVTSQPASNGSATTTTR